MGETAVSSDWENPLERKMAVREGRLVATSLSKWEGLDL